jgi:DNA-binding HxlR family transcriptional regulator
MADPAELGPLQRALSVVGDRWSLAVIAALAEHSLRYGELHEQLDGIAPNVLAARLKRLEQEGLIAAHPYSQRPLRYRYELREAARELAGAVRLLADWGAQHGGAGTEPARHDVCGTPLETRWYCPSCEEVVGDPGLGDPPDEGLLYA